MRFQRVLATAFLTLVVLAAAAAQRGKQTPPPTPVREFAPATSVPAITEPKFLPAAEADKQMSPEEPVLGLALGTHARAYSLWHLERHLVVNDRIAGRPVAVTWCPFSHTAVVYGREIGGREVTFESNGQLWNGTLVLRAREDDTLWRQADGRRMETSTASMAPGEPALAPLAAAQTLWKAWKVEQPETTVLDKGAEPITSSRYAEYDADTNTYGVGGVELKVPRMGGKSLVVGLVTANDRVAVPLHKLKQDFIASVVVDRQLVAILYDPANGTVRAVRSEARGETLALKRGYGDIFGKPTPPYIVDEKTGSRWDFTGRAVSGKMEGHRLPVVPYRVQYWYAWQAVFPKSRVE